MTLIVRVFVDFFQGPASPLNKYTRNVNAHDSKVRQGMYLQEQADKDGGLGVGDRLGRSDVMPGKKQKQQHALGFNYMTLIPCRHALFQTCTMCNMWTIPI